MYLTFDIGGSNTRIGFSEDLENFTVKKVIDTPESYSDGILAIESTVKDLVGNRSITKCAGGVAGVFDKEKTALIRGPHLKDWEEKNLKVDLENVLETQVFLENDTDMAGLGEAVYGSGKNHKIVAYITLSTGIGGSRIVDKKIDIASVGFEPGHQIIDADGSICPECEAFEGGKGKGHFEAYVSGAGIKRRFGKDAEEIEDKKIWDSLIDLISIGLNNTIVHWSPDVVVLGGGMMKSEHLDLEYLKDRIKHYLYIFPFVPEIKKSELGTHSALFGSLYYLQDMNG